MRQYNDDTHAEAVLWWDTFGSVSAAVPVAFSDFSNSGCEEYEPTEERLEALKYIRESEEIYNDLA
tara:strand:+ start:762 stop:959 length:198 start_codon:yes stop_codon:yes gene_type:complete